jgi:hypothetical protein
MCRRSGLVKFINGNGGSCALPFQVRHLWLFPVWSILGIDLLPLHLLHSIAPGNDASAALVVVLPHNIFEDHFIKQFCMDCADKQDQVAIFGPSNLVLTVFHCSVYTEHYISVVMLAGCVVRKLGHSPGGYGNAVEDYWPWPGRSLMRAHPYLS